MPPSLDFRLKCSTFWVKVYCLLGQKVLPFGLKCTAFWGKVQYLLRRPPKDLKGSPPAQLSALAPSILSRAESQESQRLKRGIADSGEPPSWRRGSIGVERPLLGIRPIRLPNSTYSITQFDLFDYPIRPIRLPNSTYSITQFDLFDCPIRPIRLPNSTYSIALFDLVDCVKGIGAERC